MTSNDLTRQQCEVLKARIGPMLRYLNRLQARMIKRGFVYSDPLLQDVIKASGAVHSLNVDLHYLSCDSGVGPLPRQREDQAESDRNHRHAD